MSDQNLDLDFSLSMWYEPVVVEELRRLRQEVPYLPELLDGTERFHLASEAAGRTTEQRQVAQDVETTLPGYFISSTRGVSQFRTLECTNK